MKAQRGCFHRWPTFIHITDCQRYSKETMKQHSDIKFKGYCLKVDKDIGIKRNWSYNTLLVWKKRTEAEIRRVYGWGNHQRPEDVSRFPQDRTMVWNSREQRHIQMAFNYEPIQFLFHLSRQNKEDFSGILNPIMCACHLKRVQMIFMGLSESVSSYVKQFRYCL